MWEEKKCAGSLWITKRVYWVLEKDIKEPKGTAAKGIRSRTQIRRARENLSFV